METRKGPLYYLAAPYQLIIGIGLIILGMFLGYGIAKVLMQLFFGFGVDPVALHTPGSLTNLVTLQISTQLCAFIFAPLMFSYLMYGSPFSYFDSLNKNKIYPYVLGVGIIFLAGFFLQFLIIDKASFVFPTYLKKIEEFSRTSQLAYDALVKKLLSVKGTGKLSIIFVMIAVIPAIGEELVFRGLIQKTLSKWLKKEFIAIAITGILFGLMHMEFFNFFALCFMGFVLGWIYSLSKNIYLSIFLHFVNNAVTFISLYTFQNGQSKINPEQKLPFYIPLFAGLLMLFMMFQLYSYIKQLKTEKGDEVNPTAS